MAGNGTPEQTSPASGGAGGIDRLRSLGVTAWKVALLLVGLGGLVAVWLYAVALPTSGGLTALPIGTGGTLIAFGSAMAGGLIGFLFGLPRAARARNGEGGKEANRGEDPGSAYYTAGTNLEDISDWLTKILVGAGLTQLGALPTEFERLVNFAARAMGSGSAVGPVAAAIIVTYLILGFMLSYLWTRTSLPYFLAKSDAEQRLDRATQQAGEAKHLARSAATSQLLSTWDRIARRESEATGDSAEEQWAEMNQPSINVVRPLIERMREDPTAVTDVELNELLDQARILDQKDPT